MDTEKYNEMLEKAASGKPVTDEGPYYHHAWWESYKGLVKGKFGGALIGTAIGGVVGGGAAIILLPVIGAVAAGVSALAFAGIGMYKGMDEFGRIGTVTGAVAAAFDTAERRNQYNLEKVSLEIKAELGNKDAAKELENLKDPAYRTAHFVPPHDPSEERGPIFWKIALVGLAVGAAAGLLLGFGGLASSLLEHVIGHPAVLALGENGIMALSAATFGAFGASFGINRDLFRKVFDQTDVLYRGKVADQSPDIMVTRGKGRAQETEKSAEIQKAEPCESYIQYPASETHFRDKQIAAAQAALANMDHTQLRPH